MYVKAFQTKNKFLANCFIIIQINTGLEMEKSMNWNAAISKLLLDKSFFELQKIYVKPYKNNLN